MMRSIFPPCLRLSLLAAPIAILSLATVASAEIFDSAASCNVDQLRKDIANGADPNSKDGDGNSVLHWAARNAGFPCVEELLKHKVKLEVRNSDGETALMKAAISSNADDGAPARTVKLLLDAGADAKIPNRFGYSPLFALVVYGNGATLLFDPDLLKPDPVTGIPPYRDREFEVARLLLDHGADPSEVDGLQQSLIQFAVEKRAPALIDLLVSYGASLSVTTPQDNRSLLHVAAMNDRFFTVPYLLKKGLDINAKDADGGTPLMLAIANDNLRSAKILLDAGADKEATDAEGFTPLLYAAAKQKFGAMELLLNGGADINAKTTKSGATALHYAANKGWREGVELLLSRHANTKIENILGLTAADLARERRHSDVADLIDNNGKIR